MKFILTAVLALIVMRYFVAGFSEANLALVTIGSLMEGSLSDNGPVSVPSTT